LCSFRSPQLQTGCVVIGVAQAASPWRTGATPFCAATMLRQDEDDPAAPLQGRLKRSGCPRAHRRAIPRDTRVCRFGRTAPR
jgi:hypothetical protein